MFVASQPSGRATLSLYYDAAAPSNGQITETDNGLELEVEPEGSELIELDDTGAP